jgi:hypothetical protein
MKRLEIRSGFFFNAVLAGDPELGTPELLGTVEHVGVEYLFSKGAAVSAWVPLPLLCSELVFSRCCRAQHATLATTKLWLEWLM